MQTYFSSETNILFARAQELKAQGMEPYARRFMRTHSLWEVREAYEDDCGDADAEEVALTLCGRLMDMDDYGDVILITIEDQDSSLQLALDAVTTGHKQMAKFRVCAYRGDYLGFEVDYLYREQGPLTARVSEWCFLALCSLPLPRRIDSAERQYRQRYVHLASDFGARQRFVTRSKALKVMRRFLEEMYRFLEVSTPCPAGAEASLSLSSERYLKQLVVGGIERVYEVRQRSSGEAASWHSAPESQQMQCCMMLADLEDMMELTEKLIAGMSRHLNATRVIPWKPQEQLAKAAEQRRLLDADPDANIDSVELDDIPVDLVPPWSRRPVYDAVADATGVDFASIGDPQAAAATVRQMGVVIDEMALTSVHDVVMAVVKQVVGPSLIQPTFLIDAAPDNSPLAEGYRDQEDEGSRFQLYINGLKFAEGYSGATDPLEHLAHGDDDFLTALKYGLPPSGGLTLDIDRLVMLMTSAEDIRDVICFPAQSQAE